MKSRHGQSTQHDSRFKAAVVHDENIKYGLDDKHLDALFGKTGQSTPSSFDPRHLLKATGTQKGNKKKTTGSPKNATAPCRRARSKKHESLIPHNTSNSPRRYTPKKVHPQRGTHPRRYTPKWVHPQERYTSKKGAPARNYTAKHLYADVAAHKRRSPAPSRSVSHTPIIGIPSRGAATGAS